MTLITALARRCAMDPEPLRQLRVEEVIRKKDELEAELAALNSVLKSVSAASVDGCGVIPASVYHHM